MEQKKATLWQVLKPVLILTLVVFGLSFVFFLWQKYQGVDSNSLVKVGVIVPDFAGKKMGGGDLRFSELAATKKIIMVNFWATWCSSCVVEMPSIVQTWNQFKDQGFEVIAVNLDEKKDGRVEKMAADLGMKFPVLMDPESDIAEIFDVHAIPLTAILNSKGEVLMLERGERDWNSGRIRGLIADWLKNDTGKTD
ncbi:MAG: TlpA family protein disulfide reductase [Bdellovibrionales bacterium]|nr:TlpA family protein disulfide reductase [Bdellovibrionales bacterium]